MTTSKHKLMRQANQERMNEFYGVDREQSILHAKEEDRIQAKRSVYGSKRGGWRGKYSVPRPCGVIK